MGGISRGAAYPCGEARACREQAHKAFKKHKADILLYVDRMDVVQRGFSDIPVLRAIAARFGPSAFFNTILVRAIQYDSTT